MKVRGSIASFKGRSSLRTWLHRIAFHEYSHWKRSHRKTEPLLIALHYEAGFTACLEAAALLAPCTSYLKHCERHFCYTRCRSSRWMKLPRS